MNLTTRLAAIVGSEHVLTDPALTASYEEDWTRRWRGRADLVVRPADTTEVAACVAACADAGVPIVPQGGNTGLVGGGVPRAGGAVLSLTRLSRIEPVDVVAAQVTAGAGATLSAVRRHARAAGLDVGIDIAARDSATVGGVVATNAGGERVLRHGPTRRHVMGVEAVLADGRVVSRLGGLVKDNVGYDIGQLLVGSEGTLGVVTRVRLRLVPFLPTRAVALVAVDDTAAAQTVFGALRDRLDTVEAAEVFHAEGLDLVCATTGLARPFTERHPTYLLVECAARAEPHRPSSPGGGAHRDTPRHAAHEQRAEALAESLAESLAEAVAAAPCVRDAVLACDNRGREALWAYRERHTEAINAAGVPVKLDIAVPPAVLPQAEAKIRRVVAEVAPDARLIVFGHLPEGNLHVNVLRAVGRPQGLPQHPPQGQRDGGVAAAVPDMVSVSDVVSDAVLRTVASYGGSISAEHGVGRAKVGWVHLSRSPEEIAAMRAIKAALDPRGLLNPGVLLPAGTPAG